MDDFDFIFVGGPARSGTTLLQKVLDLHSRIYGGPELGILPQLMETYDHLSVLHSMGKLAPMKLNIGTVRESYRCFLESLYLERLDGCDGQYVSEKTPGNELAFPMLAEVFPSAKFIWIIRDPRDILCSRRKVQERARRQERHAFGQSFRSDIQDIAKGVKAAETFRQRQGDRLLIVHYEDLVSRPRFVAESLCRFLCLEYEEGMLETERSTDMSQAIANAGDWGSPYYTVEMFDRPIETSGVGQWQRVLTKWQLGQVRAEIGTDSFQCLDVYRIGTSSVIERTVFSVWGFLVDVVQAMMRRFGNRRSH